jgi:serine/threonine-protein kinase
MGEVYRARDTKLSRDVAIKVLPQAFVVDAERLARFKREAQVLASLNHTNIAAIYGFEDADGVPALVLEFVDGPTLADRIAQGPIPVDEALAIARQIADALEAAHEQGIVHRDLKPANIKLRPDGAVKVLDFGLAKAIEPERALSPSHSMSPTITTPALTQLGMVLGTAAYMSPEQARGRPADKRSDVWAFGCVLYEMLTGTRAFEGDDVAITLSLILQKELDLAALPSDVPARIRQAIRLCLRKSPKERVPDIGSVRLALTGAFESDASASTASGVTAPLWRRVLPLTLCAVVVALFSGLVAWSLWPAPVSQPQVRFEYLLPPGQVFRNNQATLLDLSSDGRHVVYNTTDGLFLRSLDALEPRLIASTEGPLSAPFFSPDGETVAYFEGRSLMRRPISGGAARVICTIDAQPSSGSWAANDTIVFGHQQGISRVSANGGMPELVIPSKAGELMFGPQLLPDGDTILFALTTAAGATRWDQADIVAQSVSTRRRTRILPGGSAARYIPSGHLLFAVALDLFAVRFDVNTLQISGTPVSVMSGIGRPGNPATGSGAAFYALSTDGVLVYARAGSRGFLRADEIVPNTLVWVDRQGREDSFGAPPREYVYPRLSPDGQRAALSVSSQLQDIWIWDIKRRNMSPLSSNPELDGLPVWTPDSQRVIWASQRAGNLNLYWQRADGTGETERLTTSPLAHRASSVTPDGKYVLFAIAGGSAGGGQDLAMLALDGTREVTMILADPKYQELNGEVSPDGRWLAYESNENGEFEVYVRPFPAVQQGRTLISNTGGRQPVWSRNGRELFYIAADGALMSAAVETPRSDNEFAASAAVRLGGARYWDAEGSPNRGRTYDVSADGTRFLRIKEDEAAERLDRRSIVVVVNWLNELKRLVPAQ